MKMSSSHDLGNRANVNVNILNVPLIFVISSGKMDFGFLLFCHGNDEKMWVSDRHTYAYTHKCIRTQICILNVIFPPFLFGISHVEKFNNKVNALKVKHQTKQTPYRIQFYGL